MALPPFLRPAAFLAALLAATGAFAQDVTAGDLKITHPQTRPTAMASLNGVGYLTIENRGKTADRLRAASSPMATSIEIHEMSMQGNLMRMRAVTQGIPVPAGSRTRLSPDGFHLMLLGLSKQLAVGGTVPVTLEFDRAGPVRVDLAVETEDAGQAAPAGR